MRKFIFINSVVTPMFLLGLSVEAKSETPKSCQGFLATELIPDDSKIIELEPPQEPYPVNRTDEIAQYPIKLVQTLKKARLIMDKSKAMGLITKSKYDHLLEDLEELSKELDKKSKNDAFMEMTNKWFDFADRLEVQIDAYQRLSLNDQKLYFSKMKMPISFMTSHFITFLETKHLKFDYQQMYSILKNSSDLDSKADLMLYLFEFEKQILKYFSKSEFIDCLA